MRRLFESPTVADLTVLIAQLQAEQAGEEPLEKMLAEIEGLGDDEARKLLSTGLRE